MLRHYMKCEDSNDEEDEEEEDLDAEEARIDQSQDDLGFGLAITGVKANISKKHVDPATST